ncbi:unnamed protein product, partial [Owenia fusiformis]
VIYGFHVSERYICSIQNQKIPCDVLRVNGRVAMLVAMFVFSILAFGLHVTDLLFTIVMLRADETLLPVLEEKSKKKIVHERPPAPVEDAIMCENYTNLEKKLNDKKQALIVLRGPTGSGKTQLALLYAKKFTNKNSDSTCFCFNSSTPEDILVDGKKLIDQCKLNIQIFDSGRDGEDSANMTNKAWRLLIRIRDKSLEDNKKSLFIFDRAMFDTSSIVKEVFLNHSSFTVIITSSDDNDAFVKGFENLTLEVKGYSKADVDALTICQYNQFKGKDMQNLAKKLDYLPLGIHAACQYIIESKGTIPKLLDQLKGGKEDALDSLFQMSHKKACKECEQDEKAKLLLNVVAALSPDPIPFDVLDWTIGSGNEDPFQRKADRSIELDKMAKRRNKIIDVITRFHLGTVEIKGSDNKMLRMHNIPIRAIQKSWDENERITYSIEMLLILDDLVDKDIRRAKDFNFFLKLIPHVKLALRTDLKGAKEQAVGINIVQISLQDKLHYMYSQTGLIRYFNVSDSKAKQLCYSKIIKKDESCLDEEAKKNLPVKEIYCITDTKFIKEKAKLINDRLKEIPIPVKPKDFLKALVCTRRLNSEIVELLKKKKKTSPKKLSKKQKTEKKSDGAELPGKYLKDTGSKSDDDRITSKYKKWVNHGAAISLKEMKNLYLIEFMANILYTHGRMYFYKSKNEQEAKVYEHDLRLAYELSVIIKEESGKQIATLLLAERNGFLYTDVDSKNQKRIDTAIERYKKLYNADGDYYEKGLLKIIPREDKYHHTICQKQLLNCYIATVKVEENSTKKQNKYKEGCKEAKNLLDGIKDENYQSKAEIYIKFGDLEMAMNEPTIKNKKYLNNAIEKYEKVLKLEDKVPSVNQRADRKIEALQKIAECLYGRHKKDWKKAKNYATRAIDMCTKEKIKKDTITKLQHLLDAMNDP